MVLPGKEGQSCFAVFIRADEKRFGKCGFIGDRAKVQRILALPSAHAVTTNRRFSFTVYNKPLYGYGKGGTQYVRERWTD
jgi:hypothetical protein